MKIPDKTSITLRKASEISMGAKKITHGWQFGIFSDDTELRLILFKSTEPENGTEIHIPRTYKHGRIFSFVLEFTDEEMELLDFAAALVKDPNHVPDEVYEPLQARYDEETLVLIVTTAVLTLANNYWNNIVGTPIDDYLHDGHYVERELDIQKAAKEQEQKK